MTIDPKKAAIALTGSTPLKVRLCDDGSLVVIASNGQKFRFTAAEVRSAVEAKTPKRGRSIKSGSSTPRQTKSNGEPLRSNPKG